MPSWHVHLDLRPVCYFPGRRHPAEGTVVPWAILRWRKGAFWSTWTVRSQVPEGYLRLACRAGLHFMIHEFLLDAYACACRKIILRQEDIRRD